MKPGTCRGGIGASRAPVPQRTKVADKHGFFELQLNLYKLEEVYEKQPETGKVE
ncbi:MAG: hypothetical protein OEQ30_05270 [Gammaproteobacteria bacterium]|jgi:hypothetical protein|nr:hypothetical protein [Gammaproteobacteria bacterium]MDH3757933.1 hypothetical protein [Gammaproteobacteria bacterium]MDH3848010.1 hypothetical protein [Gammaproteobacteria bacterium]MDH3863651.1 hypothetical protein [Gammaproteobacteria bacterium]MDH3907312.1 hypothetical protein [Gammaproteobacteria bacterium]